MKFGVPWSNKGIPPKSRETAEEAARRAGMSLDDWLYSVIAKEAGLGNDSSVGPKHSAELSRRIEQHTRGGPAAYAPPRMRNGEPPAPVAPDPHPPVAQPPPPQVQLPPALEQALAQIANRQRTLNGKTTPIAVNAPPAAASTAASAPPVKPPAAPSAVVPANTPAVPQQPPPPAQNLKGLEDQLRNITTQIEALRQPGVEQAINALRAELGEIGQALHEAMPRRELEAIETQIQDLARRVAEGRQAGADADTLTRIEQDLTEVRGALRALTPAENLVGYHEAVAGLAKKIDVIVTDKDPATLQQLQSAIVTLREMVTHVASNATVSRLSSEVQQLAKTIDRVSQTGVGSDVLANLEQRITALSDSLAERVQSGGAISARLEDLVESLQDKTEQLQKYPGMMQQLQSTVSALRDMVAKTASNDSLSRLANDVQKLSASIEHIRAAAPAGEALANIEHRITELSDSLLEQARSGGASPQLEALVRALSDKIEQLQQGSGNTVAVGHLEGSIDKLAALSDSLVEHARNGDAALPHIEAVVHALSDKIDQLQHASGDTVAVVHLEESIDRLVALSASLVEHARNSAAAAPQLEALVHALSEKIEQIQQAPGENIAIAHLEDSIVKLVEKLDATGSRFAKLDAIERGVSDLLVHVEDLRASRSGGGAEAAPAGDTIKQDIARTQDALEAVHDTLGHVVDRLAMIEQDIRDRPRASAPTTADMAQPAGNLAVRLVSDAGPLAPAATPAPLPQPAAMPPRMPAGNRAPVDSDLAPDHPIEPGSRQAYVNPAARIAASETALGEARPVPPPSAGSKSNFIAAARRAAQAAAQEQGQRLPRGETGASPAADAASLPSRLMRRVKTMFIAASAIAVVIGSVQIASRFHMFGSANSPADKFAEAIIAVPEKLAGDLTGSNGARPATIASKPHAPPALPMISETAANTPSAGVIMPGSNVGSLLSAPGASPPLDITGSIARAPAKQAPAPKPVAPAGEASLPAAIGGNRLRSAANAGNAAAAYEVGLRFAEGRGVQVNLEQAAHWFERAAGNGLAPAQFRLASLLEKGQGVTKDLSRARRLYLEAAAQGNAKAMHNLAVLYAEGADGKPDYAAAVQWFRKAAERGIADSQFNLAVLAARGLGMDQNLSESYKWFALAAKNGDKEAAKKRDEVAGRLDAEALAAAKRAVDSFIPVRQPVAAVTVSAPPGGWDSAAAPAKPKARSATSVRVGKR
jgi:localization factor PodJL